MENNKKKILIIEDDIDIANLEKDYLEINNFETKICSDGHSALQAINSDQYDGIVLDLMIPEISGFELCKEIRKTKDVPIIIVSAKNESSDIILGLGLGSDDYITKPFDPQELVARVKSHLRRYDNLVAHNKPTNEDVIIIDNLKIYRKNYKVLIDNQEVKFANKEFELLLFLATNPNIVFSKETLFEKIWGFNFISDTATVTVHINRIRDKIEKDPNKPKLIETVWGAGYRFNM